jgi:predicted AAA+ superfamily ATPase
MIKDYQKLKLKASKLYSRIRKTYLKVSEINAGAQIFEDEVGKLYIKLIQKLFEELGLILSYFEEEYDETSVYLYVEQEILFSENEGAEFSVFTYRRLFNKLLGIYHDFEPTPLTNALENYILDKVIGMDNSFNAAFYRLDFDEIPDIIKKEYEYFLENLKSIFKFNFVLFFDEYGSLLEALTPKGHFIDSLFDKIPSLYFIDPSNNFESDVIPYTVERGNLKLDFLNAKDWSLLLQQLHFHIHNFGYGHLSRYYFFEWNREERDLFGYYNYNPIKLTDIVGYEKQLEELVFNTEAFLSGYNANNILIYGYRGCGKTSAINALVEEFKEETLRLVKITKEDMDDLPLIVDMLSERKEMFIISPDDLSYDEGDREYKRHKVILDTMLDRCPDNIIIYATSNTQDLVKFAKRFTTDDIKVDNRLSEEKKLEFLDKQFYDEKRALTDRFGLTILFGKPDKAIYSKILFKHASLAGLDLSTDEKKEELLKQYEAWTLFHGTPGGRSAANFTGYIAAKTNMK